MNSHQEVRISITVDMPEGVSRRYRRNMQKWADDEAAALMEALRPVIVEDVSERLRIDREKSSN